MTNSIRIGQWLPGPPGKVPASTQSTVQNANRSKTHQGASFQDVLDANMLKFSQHAQNRLEQRGIRLDSGQLTQIGQAVEQAAAKGAKESLILYGELALIVNVKNQTVVTAMDSNHMKDHVFTQIDSAVIVKE